MSNINSSADSSTRPIIDMRARPAWLHDFFGATPGSAGERTARWLNRRMGSRENPGHFTASRTLAGFARVIAEAGVDTAVVVGRQIPGQYLANERIAEVAAALPGRAIGLAGIDTGARHADAADDTMIDAISAIEHAVEVLGLRGVNIEPGFDTLPCQVDDRRLTPICVCCERLGIPLAIMSGPTVPDPACNSPAAILRLARRHPALQIICYHGVYPHVTEIIGAALVAPNIHLVPDMYLFAPGAGLYMQAAAGALGEQIMFASSYPFRPIRQSIGDALALARKAGLSATAIERFFHGNAARLLGLKPAVARVVADNGPGRLPRQMLYSERALSYRNIRKASGQK